MKAILLTLLPLGLVVSCTQNSPTPAAPPAASNQYGVPGAADPYGVPPAPGAYNQGANAPYQPVDPVNPPAAAPITQYPSPDPAPVNAATYTIQKGDTFWGISRRHGVSVNALRQANPQVQDNALPIGGSLNIPAR